MNKAAPWSIKGVDFDAREAAREAARRSGMSLGDWLNNVIAEEAAAAGVDVESINDSDRLEAVTARLAQLSKRPQGRAARRDDADPAEAMARRRRPVVARERQEIRDYPEERDHGRDRAPFRDPEAMLDEAFRAFERGAQRSGDRTAAAMSEVARRLEDIESQIGAPRQGQGGESARDAISKIEARLEAIARRTERDAREHSAGSGALAKIEARLESLARAERDGDDRAPSSDALAKIEARLEAIARQKEEDSRERARREIERRVAAVQERVEAPRAQPPAKADPDIARIEAKLNRLLDGAARPAPAPVPRPAPQATFDDAVEQITRRQRALDAGLARPRPVVAPERRGYAPAPPVMEMTALQKDIASLSEKLEQTRRDVLDREEQARHAPAARSPDLSALHQNIAGIAEKLEQTRREVLEREERARGRPRADAGHVGAAREHREHRHEARADPSRRAGKGRSRPPRGRRQRARSRTSSPPDRGHRRSFARSRAAGSLRFDRFRHPRSWPARRRLASRRRA